MNRRALLTALGLAPMSLALPSALAFAGPTRPKRLVVYLSAQGCAPWLWKCDPYERGDVAWSDDWTGWNPDAFSDSLHPLYDLRHHCTAVGGLGVLSAVAEGKDQQHRLSAAHVLTGAQAVWYTGSAMGGGPSVDQIVADHVSAHDQLRSLETSIYRGLGLAQRKALYREALHPLGAATSPAQVWDRLYGERPASEIRDALLQSFDRFAAVSSKLMTDDQHLLEQHRSLMDQVLTQAEAFEARTCDAPTYEEGAEGVRAELEQLTPLLLTALSCDLTRVITIQAGEAKVDELEAKQSIHGACHAMYSDPVSADIVAQNSAYHAARFASLLESLDSVDDGDGTLLDNTLVLWMSELGDGAHGYDDYPVVVAGGRNSGVQLGRYVHYPRVNPIDSGRDGEQRMMGMPHNRLLVSVCRAMGINIDTVGLSSVRGWDDSMVDLTGALPELLT